MAKPFQFRLQDLFAMIAATAVALALLRLSISLTYAEPLPSLVLRRMSIVATIAAFGAAAGRLFMCSWQVAMIAGALYLGMTCLLHSDGDLLRFASMKIVAGASFGAAAGVIFSRSSLRFAAIGSLVAIALVIFVGTVVTLAGV